LRFEEARVRTWGHTATHAPCALPAGTIEEFVVKHIRTIAADPVMLTRVTKILQRRHAERAPAIEKELAQLAAEQQRCRQEGKRVLQAIGGEESRRSD
jgi:hypothetical protein